MEGSNSDLGIPNVDLSKVKPLNQKRSVAFTNNFIARTASFLNRFAVVAEQDLAQQTLEMQKLEIALNIIEEKLASIPGLNEAYAKKTGSAAPAAATESAPQAQAAPAADAPQTPPEAAVPEPPPPAVVENFVAVKDDTRYARFIKMMNVGVPVPAVEGKMRAEGLDPALLHTPDAPLPQDDEVLPTGGDDDSSDEELSSFSESD